MISPLETKPVWFGSTSLLFKKGFIETSLVLNKVLCFGLVFSALGQLFGLFYRLPGNCFGSAVSLLINWFDVVLLALDNLVWFGHQSAGPTG